jgi:hypothetical protein
MIYRPGRTKQHVDGIGVDLKVDVLERCTPSA